VRAAPAYLTVFVAAALTTFAFTPLVRRLAVRFGAVAQPSDRRVHPVPTPTMGGVAMWLGLAVGLGASTVLPFFDDMNAASPEPFAALVTGGLMVGLGGVDDLREILPLTKLTGQIFVAGVLAVLGVQLTYMWFPPNNVVVLSPDLGTVLAIAWVVVVANAVNLVDGLDGLAAGMVAIAAGAFFVFMVRTPTSFEGNASAAALLSAVTAGICVGFLPWNFNPARIFMGDSGAMLLGVLLSIAMISGVGTNSSRPARGDFAVIAGVALVPFLVLFVPLLDVGLAVLRRTRRRQSLGTPDKEHLHHLLMDLGHSHRRAVLLMYLWSALLSGSGLAVGLINGRFAVAMVLVGAAGLFLVTFLPLVMGRRRANGERRARAERSAPTAAGGGAR
jgi:UDP-GlcNAc:undecaprenyl-phosphate/decaprenyl-phosphate GlcNAc-1-phosphate transferase